MWECKQWERHVIIKRIVEYLLMRHLSVSKEDVTVTVDQLDFCLCRGKEDPISHSGGLLEAYEELSKRLWLVDDIPLKVSSVQALDSAVRFTSAVPPEPHFLAKEKAGNWMEQKLASACIHPVKVVIQGSGNWPMDEVTTEKTKSAFLLQIGASLGRKWGMTCVAEEDNVDVLLSGYAFRLKILHERGLKELAKQAGGKQMRQVSLVDKGLHFCSQHSSMINGLQGRYPIYGPVVRLAKRWAASHLFSSCLVEEAIELLVAHLFLKPWPFTLPSSRICGFLRFLRLLSEYDWDFSPLIVDINSDMTAHDEEEINENFRKSKEESSDIEHEFGGHFKLWYDNLGGDVVGLTWKKSISKKRAREEDGEAMKNDPIKILRAIGHAGKGMVKSVHLIKAPKLN